MSTEIIEPRETINPVELAQRYEAAQVVLLSCVNVLTEAQFPQIQVIIDSLCRAGIFKLEANMEDLRMQLFKPRRIRVETEIQPLVK